MGDRILYFVQDETDSCELHALVYFNFLEPNDIVRVRNLRAIDGNRRHLVMNKFSNILKIPRITSHANELIKRIERKINDHKNLEEKALNEVKRDDVVYAYMEFPQRILIEPNFDKINAEKYFGNMRKDEIQNNFENENEKEKEKENSQNLSKMDIEEKVEEEEIEVEEKVQINNNEEFLSEEARNDKMEAKEPKALDAFKSKIFCEIKETDKYVLLTLNVLDYYPKNILEFCMIYCPECQER